MDYKYISSRLNEIDRIKKMIENNSLRIKEMCKTESIKYIDGISVIIPSYKGENHILRCISSLINQSLDKSLYDVIIIINGEKDSTQEKLKHEISKYNINNIEVVYTEIPSASNARNIGIELAKRKYITFIDDDDYISFKFLEEMYVNSDENRLVISQIVDVNQDGEENKFNNINKQILNSQECVDKPLINLNMLLTINACKLIPTKVVKKIKYDTNLRSGEDVVFFTELISQNVFDYYVIKEEKNAIYYRIIRSNSVSRKQLSYRFNVIERLEVIQRLDNILLNTTHENKVIFIKQKIDAQSLFINRYLKVNYKDREKIVGEIEKLNLTYIPYNCIYRGLAEDLIVSYCFPPYIDTSGNVMAKRIRDDNKVVDVIYNNMSKIRKKDDRLNLLINDLIENRVEINSYPSFSNWNAIKSFCEIGLNEISRLEDKKEKYKNIYSRIMFPASHFLAYEYKLINPKVKWIAEFSDPILLDINSRQREMVIDDSEYIKKLKKKINKQYNIDKHVNNLFFLCELIPYLFADELIFTNENQFQYMLDNFPIEEVKQIIKDKSVIKRQPTLPSKFYNMIDTNYKVEKDKVNFAYFGSFYETRNLDDVIKCFESLNSNYKDKYIIHIFTNNPKEFYRKVESESPEIIGNFKVNGYVSFLEFLNITTKFDCLIVNDAVTKGIKFVNPYLPSKLSDYIGSATSIWGICEINSPMYKYDIEYKSIIGDLYGGKQTLNEIMKNKIDIKLSEKIVN